MKHKHAELMAQYAQDAMETDKPWERWEYLATECTDTWQPCEGHPSWIRSNQYRRKPRTININGHEVPEPVREPLENGQGYYFVTLDCLVISNGVANVRWDSSYKYDLARLKAGIIHLTPEAAETHAKALLSFTEKQ